VLALGVVTAIVAAAVAVAVRGSDKPVSKTASKGSNGAAPTTSRPHGAGGGSHGAAGARGPTHGLGAHLAAENRAADAALRYTSFVTAGVPRRREIALTFDDGPSPYTEPILHTLLRTHTPATFFIVGQQLGPFGRVLKDEIRNGFEIGDHTENHKWLPRLDARAQYGQINDAGLRIRQLGGAYPRLFRPPYGALSDGALKVLRSLRMLTVLWSVDPGDWRRPGTRSIISSVLARVQPGSIVILHDGGGYRDQTVAALPAIIDGLRRRHYTLVSMAQLLHDDPPPRHQRLPRLSGQ
jgi:peptidoglycan/xylan/chitin deacetylase (PgdA/CDA1 family)